VERPRVCDPHIGTDRQWSSIDSSCNEKVPQSCIKIYDFQKLDISYMVLYVLQHDVNSKNNFYKKIETKLNLT
jgi:hypothetical protein